MKKEINIIRHELHSPEWFAHRLDYVCSSEVGGLLGLQPDYYSAARIFNEKIGLMEQWTEGNRHTYFGLKMEDVIAEAWKYYHPSNQYSYIENEKKDEVQRKCKQINGYVVNPKYPWLSVSLDRLAQKGQFTLHKGYPACETEFPVELKTIDAHYMEKFSEGVPPAYVTQLHCQMLALEVGYSELVMLTTRKEFHIFPVAFSQQLADRILDMTKEFWYNRVIPAKGIVDGLGVRSYDDLSEEHQKAIGGLEPPPDEGKAYEQFIKEKYRDSYVEEVIQGTDEDFASAVDYHKVGEEIKELNKKKQGIKNKILAGMGKYEKIILDENSYATNFANKNGVRTLRVKID